MQQGYGFVTFEAFDSATRVPGHLEAHGIHFQCSITHKHNPKFQTGRGSGGMSKGPIGSGFGSPAAGTVGGDIGGGHRGGGSGGDSEPFRGGQQHPFTDPQSQPHWQSLSPSQPFDVPEVLSLNGRRSSGPASSAFIGGFTDGLPGLPRPPFAVRSDNDTEGRRGSGGAPLQLLPDGVIDGQSQFSDGLVRGRAQSGSPPHSTADMTMGGGAANTLIDRYLNPNTGSNNGNAPNRW